MPTIDSVLRRSLADRGGALVLTLDPVFQGLPDTAHGGSVLAAFDALAALPAPRDVRGVYRRRVPLGVPLTLVAPAGDGTRVFTLSDRDGTVLVDGRVAPAAERDAGVAGPLVDHASGRAVCERAVPGAGGDPQKQQVFEGPRRAGEAQPLPVSRTCFACGVDNPLGMRGRLEADDAEVRGAWRPREAFRTPAGGLATAAVTALLDEAAFWLGALATGESGMTTDLRVRLHAVPPFGPALTVRGARAAVRVRAGDPRYRDAEVVAATEDGRLVASARITFVAVRGAARRLVSGLLAMNDPARLRRVFPSYVRAGA